MNTLSMPRTGYVMVPVEWLDDPDLGSDEIAVLVAMRRHADHRDGTLAVRQGLLATKLRRSRPWVNAVIARLEALGRVERFRIEGRRCCGYRLPDVVALAEGKTRCREADTTSASACPTRDTKSQPVDTELNPENKFHPRADRASAHEEPVGVRQVVAEVPPADWQPEDADLMWAMDRYPNADLAEHTDAFVARCRAKGYAFRDVSAGWRAWLVEDCRKAKERTAERAQRLTASNPAHARVAAWAAAAATARTVHRPAYA